MSDGRVPLPKFGEWDLKNPGSAGEFTVIFDKARNAKKLEERRKFDPNSPIFKKDREVTFTTKHNARRRFRKSTAPPSSYRRWFCCCMQPAYYAES